MTGRGDSFLAPAQVVPLLRKGLPTWRRAAVLAITAEGRIAYWDQATERLLGWPAHVVLGKRVTELGPRHVRERTEETMAILQARVSNRGEAVHWRGPGLPIACFSMIFPLGDIVRGRGVIVGVMVAAAQRRLIERDEPRIRAALQKGLGVPPDDRRRPGVRPPRRLRPLPVREQLARRFAPVADPTHLTRALRWGVQAGDRWGDMQVIEAYRYRAERVGLGLRGAARARRLAAIWARVAQRLSRR